MRLLSKFSILIAGLVIILSQVSKVDASQGVGPQSGAVRCDWNAQTHHCHCEVQISQPRTRCRTIDGNTRCFTTGGQNRVVDRSDVNSSEACGELGGIASHSAPPDQSQEAEEPQEGGNNPSTPGASEGNGNGSGGCEGNQNPLCSRISNEDITQFQHFLSQGFEVSIGYGGPGGVAGGAIGAVFGGYLGGPTAAIASALLGSHAINPWYNRRREVQIDEDRRNLEGTRQEVANAEHTIVRAFQEAVSVSSASLASLDQSHQQLDSAANPLSDENNVVQTPVEMVSEQQSTIQAQVLYDLGRAEAVTQETGKPLIEAVQSKGAAIESLSLMQQAQQEASSLYHYVRGFVQAHPILTETIVGVAMTMNPMTDLGLATAQAISIFSTDRTLFGNPAESTADKVLAVAGVILPLHQIKQQIGAFARARNVVHATSERVRTFLFPQANAATAEEISAALRSQEGSTNVIVEAVAARHNTEAFESAVRRATESVDRDEIILAWQGVLEATPTDTLENLRQIRRGYETEVQAISDGVRMMRQQGLAEEAIAREANTIRRNIGLAYKERTPQPFRDMIYRRNFITYEDELGPTFEYLIRTSRSDGSRNTFQSIIESAIRTNSELNRILGI